MFFVYLFVVVVDLIVVVFGYVDLTAAVLFVVVVDLIVVLFVVAMFVVQCWSPSLPPLVRGVSEKPRCLCASWIARGWKNCSEKSKKY